jgi:hypothetical protein
MMGLRSMRVTFPAVPGTINAWERCVAAANAAWAAFAAFSGGTDTDVAKTRRRGTV